MNIKKIVLIGIVAIFILGVLLFVIAGLWIGSDVRRYCKRARLIYGGDCVYALMEEVNDYSIPYRDRNHAIWALGQIGDPKALPYITKFYTGRIPQTENPDTALSQRELEKAVRLMQGGLNISAIVWRHNIN